LYLLAYEIGLSVIGASNGAVVPALPEMHWHDGFYQAWVWLTAMGKPLLIGLPLLSVGLAMIGYISGRVAWRLFVMWKWHRRHG